MGKKDEIGQADVPLVSMQPLWELGITEVTGHNLETQGRKEVNRLLKEGWLLLHVYTLKYQEDNIWRERPMAILGLPGKHSD